MAESETDYRCGQQPCYGYGMHGQGMMGQGYGMHGQRHNKQRSYNRFQRLKPEKC